MNDRADGSLAALERRLARQRPLPPTLRQRVLAAVDDVLHDGVCYRQAAGVFSTRIPFAAGAVIALALSLLLALILPQRAMDADFQPARLRPLPSLVDRARAAGIDFDLPPADAGRLAIDLPTTPSEAVPVHVLRLIDARRLLEGEL